MRLLLVVLLLLAAPAFAQSLDQLKAQGVVGERADGYVGLVAGGSSPLVEQINAERRRRYEEIAQRNGTDRAAVEAIAGARLIREAPAGTFVLDSSGRWQRR